MNGNSKKSMRVKRGVADVSELEHLSKEDLMHRVIQLETQVTQLKNVIARSSTSKDGLESKKSKCNQRAFDFNKYNTRHVALKIAYLGWDYQGFAAQDDTNQTIEAMLFEALTKTRLIESRSTSCYHRCGRTDKGVSAFSQVISIDLRTNLLEGKGVKVRERGTVIDRLGDKSTEICYVHILNKVLPPVCRVLAWSPVDVDFSARFSCKSRTYKYFFPRGDLNLERMNTAGQCLIGEKDYRNFCKMDVANGVIKYVRRILSVDIRSTSDIFQSRIGADCNTQQVKPVVSPTSDSYEMCEITISGLAFLWHQIRCIVAVLFMIGQGKEDPQIVADLLDVDKHPCKPQYTMASELPLVLFDCQFEEVNWMYDVGTHSESISHLQEMWTKHSVKTSMLKRMLDDLETTPSGDDSKILSGSSSSTHAKFDQVACLIPGNRPRNYISLLERDKCEGLEERIGHYARKRKLQQD